MDWTSSSKNSWKDSLLESSLTPIQQYNYTVGKNSSDSAMIIDAMDVLYTGNVDGFIIVSSDSDFTKLAMRLRESGKRVIGMGESKTPTPFVRACEQFKTLDVLYKNNNSGTFQQGIFPGILRTGSPIPVNPPDCYVSQCLCFFRDNPYIFG